MMNSQSYSFEKNPDDVWQDHKILARLNQGRLDPRLPTGNWRDEVGFQTHLLTCELKMLEEERLKVAGIAAQAPRTADEFIKWFEELRDVGPGQNDPLFPWLAEKASVEQMTWFLRQEVAGEAGFDDLAALTQVKMPTRPKLEIARNYWDEMGRGRENGMHGPMLARLAEEMGVADTPLESIVPESLALANILIALASHRRYAFHSLGALGAVELTAPDRTHQVYRGLKRLGVSGEGQRYYLLHSTLDKKHSAAWNQEVIRPLVEENPRVATAIAEGALLRLAAGARCFERYRRVLWSKKEVR